jgi:ribosome-binding factor A
MRRGIVNLVIRSDSRLPTIKTAQKEAAIFRIIGPLFQEAVRENAALEGIFVTRVELSSGKSTCYIYCYTALGKDKFKEALQELKLFKPSMRKALSIELNARYTPDIVFVFDTQLEKTMHMELLLDAVKQEVLASEEESDEDEAENDSYSS